MKLGVYMLWTEMRGTDAAASVSASPAAELRATPLRAMVSGGDVASADRGLPAAPKSQATKRTRVRRRTSLVEATR